jgi:hypothetical protein
MASETDRLFPEWPAAGQLTADEVAALKRALGQLEASYRTGTVFAAFDAFTMCQVYRQRQPDWVTPAVFDVFVRGVRPADVQRWNRRVTDFVRWATVRKLREPHDGFRPMSWERAWEEAAAQLEGQIGEGEADTIRRSYGRVQRDYENDQLSKYWSTDFAVHSLLEAGGFIRPGPA